MGTVTFESVRAERSAEGTKSKPAAKSLRLRRCAAQPVLSEVEGLGVNGENFTVPNR
jgi:hypothetical protein